MQTTPNGGESASAPRPRAAGQYGALPGGALGLAVCPAELAGQVRLTRSGLRQGERHLCAVTLGADGGQFAAVGAGQFGGHRQADAAARGA